MNINSTGTKAYVDNTSTTAVPSLQSIYNPPRPRGEVGWICPVCGRGNAPSTAYCNCNITKPDIVYANGGTRIPSILDDATPCHTNMNEYTTISVSSNDTKYTDAAEIALTSTGDSKGQVFGKSTYTN
jgi:hypothetical protein